MAKTRQEWGIGGRHCLIHWIFMELLPHSRHHSVAGDTVANHRIFDKELTKGWMASPTRWAWVHVNSRSLWCTGRPDMLRFMGSQRVGHNWATELNRTELTNVRQFRKWSFLWWEVSHFWASLPLWPHPSRSSLNPRMASHWCITASH